MANFQTPAVKVAQSTVAALRYLSVLPRTINRDAESAYEAGYGTTVNVPLPVKATANELSKTQRDARTAITYNDLTRKYVPVNLDTQVYSAARLPSDWQTWTLQDFEAEVAKPEAEAVVDALPKKIAALMDAIQAPQDANPSAALVATSDAKATKIKADGSNLFAVLSRLRRVLNKNEVPFGDRYLAVGPAVGEIIQSNRDILNAAFSADNGDALHEATLGKLFGMTVVEDPRLPEAKAVAYHRDAFTMAMRAADVPLGASFGAARADDGFALRLICDYDPDHTEDRAVVDAYVGFAVMDSARAIAVQIG